jgi:hypothetical protein
LKEDGTDSDSVLLSKINKLSPSLMGVLANRNSLCWLKNPGGLENYDLLHSSTYLRDRSSIVEWIVHKKLFQPA